MTKDKFLTLARERFKLAQESDDRQRQRELEDLKFYAGEQWDKDLLDSRKGQTIGSGSNQQIVPARVSMTINKCREPVRQVLNQERESDFGVELIPADDFGELAGPIDHTEIELREGLVRRIQRDSEAADARTWAFARSAIAGRGFWGVMTRFVPGKTWDQEIYVQRFYNQSSVSLDPTHEQPDGSDAEWAFVGVDMPLDQYQAEFPSTKAKPNRVASANNEEWRQLGDEAPDWFHTEGEIKSVRVVDYYYIDRTTETLYQLSNGKGAYKDELASLPPGVTVVNNDNGTPNTRPETRKTIKYAKIDGVNVLDEMDWLGHYIPIIKVVGEELQPYDNERRCEGIVRPMIPPCRGNNYIISKFVEQVGLTPIPPWMGPSGFDEGYEDEYNASTTRALSRLHYNQKDSFGMPIPPGAVSRTNISTDVQALAFGVQMFGQAIASTSLVPETALGNADPTVKSGKLAKMLLDQAERGTSNFLDNLKRSMRHEARIVNDLLFPIYGRAGRLARLMNPEGEMSAVLIGQPFTHEGDGKMARPVPAAANAPNAKTYKLTKDAEFNVAIKISKSQGTRREQEAQTLGEMISADPTLMGVLGDLFFKYQDGPGHEEMSERMKAVLVPPVQALLSGKQAPTPELMQAQQQMQAMGVELQKLQQIVQTDQVKAQAGLQEAQIKTQADLQQTQMELASKEKIALIQANAGIAEADIRTQNEDLDRRLKLIELFLTANQEARLDQEAKIHEAGTQGREHRHEVGMAHVQAELAPEPVQPEA